MQEVVERDAYGIEDARFKLGGMSRDVLENLIFKGAIKSYLVGRRRFISASEIKRFIRECEQGAAQGAATPFAVMDWIESHPALLRHPKLYRLMADLRADRYKVIGHLHALWWWAASTADLDGKLPPGTTNEAVADGAGWPTEDADNFVKALRKAGFMEKRGFQLHDWNDYTWRFHAAKAKASNNGSRGNHQRWHVARNEVDPDCEYCKSESLQRSPNESLQQSLSDRTYPSTPPHPPLPDQPENRNRRTYPTPKPIAIAQHGNSNSLRGHRLNPSEDEWRDILHEFPGINAFARLGEWVDWIEQGGGRREPENKLEAFKGFLRKTEQPKAVAVI